MTSPSTAWGLPLDRRSGRRSRRRREPCATTPGSRSPSPASRGPAITATSAADWSATRRPDFRADGTRRRPGDRRRDRARRDRLRPAIRPAADVGRGLPRDHQCEGPRRDRRAQRDRPELGHLDARPEPGALRAHAGQRPGLRLVLRRVELGKHNLYELDDHRRRCSHGRSGVEPTRRSLPVPLDPLPRPAHDGRGETGVRRLPRGEAMAPNRAEADGHGTQRALPTARRRARAHRCRACHAITPTRPSTSQPTSSKRDPRRGKAAGQKKRSDEAI